MVRGAQGWSWGVFAERLKAFYWFTGGLWCGEEAKLISISVAAKGEVVEGL